MGTRRRVLSPKAVAVLRMIARGNTYERILATAPELTYLDIFNAASEVLEIIEVTSNDSEERLDRIRKIHPRAYMPWSDEEDAQLIRLVRSGTSLPDIARVHQRQASAIRSRMARLGLMTSGESSNTPQHDDSNGDVPDDLPF